MIEVVRDSFGGNHNGVAEYVLVTTSVIYYREKQQPVD